MTLYTVATGDIIQAADINQTVNWLNGFAANVKDYGAKGDEKMLTDGGITTGTPTFTSATAAFTAADVGKLITVNGAGATANLNTTISGYTNATTVTLAANAGRTVSAATFYYGTDDTVAITNARNAANTPAGGVVTYPPGTYLTGGQTLLPYVHEIGAGVGQSCLKLKAGSNTDLFSAQTASINIAGAFGTGDLASLSGFSIEHISLDGNRANQTSGPSYPIRFYGYDFTLRSLEIKHGYSGGILCDWFGLLTPPFPVENNGIESLLTDIKIHDTGGIGLQMGGPHDSFMSNVISSGNASHGFHFGPNNSGLLSINIHPYWLVQSVSACGILCEAQGCSFVDCMIEGSDFVQMCILANDISFQGGQIFGNPGYAGVGMQLGQVAGGTPIPGQANQSAGAKTAVAVTGCDINTKFNACTNGSMNFLNESANMIYANIYQTSGTPLVNPPNLYADTYTFNVTGQTTDGTLGKSGGMAVQTNGGTAAFTVNDRVSGTVFRVDSNGNLFASAGFNTPLGYYFTSTTVAASLATGGTITCQGLSNVSVAPTVAVTGVIMQTGWGGQFCVVVNASAFSITMAAQATSHVANGVSCVIAANTARAFFYNGTTSLWYPCS